MSCPNNAKLFVTVISREFLIKLFLGMYLNADAYFPFQLRARVAREAARAEGVPRGPDYDGQVRPKVTGRRGRAQGSQGSSPPLSGRGATGESETWNNNQASFQTAGPGQAGAGCWAPLATEGWPSRRPQPLHWLALPGADLAQLGHLARHQHEDVPGAGQVTPGLQTAQLQQCRALCRLRRQSVRSVG